MTSHTVRVSAILVFAAVTGICSGAERLNVLFIAVDDMRVELGCYGNSPAKTPILKRQSTWRRTTLMQRRRRGRGGVC